MGHTINLLQDDRILQKLYEGSTKSIKDHFGLNQIEIEVIDFLAKHPDQNTACDIVKSRVLQKGNVSMAVESLIKKNLLRRLPDKEDRRKIHLYLTLPAETISYEIAASHQVFYSRIFSGMDEDERAQYTTLVDKIMSNARYEWEEFKKAN